MIYQTTIIATILLSTMLIAVRKKYFLVPFILAACFIPEDQRVIVLDLDFQPLRILVLVGFLRIIIRSEGLRFKWNRFDKLILIWALCGMTVYVIQWADMRALIYRCGTLFDIIGLYWLFRLNISSWSDIKIGIKTLAVCSLVLTFFVGYEWATGQNPFVVMGRAITAIREGRYRCQASFPHSIMLGLFWTTIIPFFIGFAKQDKNNLLLWSAVGASIFMIAATASSTPYLTLMAVLFLLFCYRWRKYTSTAAWGMVASIIALHIVMRAPVWHLIARVSVVSGSTGWQRYNIINQAVNHFNEWVYLGCRSTAHWGHGLFDVTNQYVIEGVRGGLITLILFLILLYAALRILLRISLQYRGHKEQFLVWCVFVVMLGHCIAFFGVPYFGQMRMWWYMTLAIVSFISENKINIPRKITISQPLEGQIKTAAYIPNKDIHAAQGHNISPKS